MTDVSTTGDYFAALRGAEFVVLTTYRRNGTPVPTTIWFANVGNALYLTTAIEAGKTKRIRSNPQVLIAPSDQVGKVQGPTLTGNARILAPDEYAPAIAAMLQTYGEKFTLMTDQMDATRPPGSRVYVIVTP